MTTEAPAKPVNNGDALAPAEKPPALAPTRLPYHPAVQDRFGIDRASWKALVEAIFPNATCVESVILALSYCRARKIDPFKRCVHIVPIWNKQKGCMVDTIWPGIGELRTTAFRTGQYAGRGPTVYGPTLKQKVGKVEIEFPEWAQVSLFRTVGGERVEFAGPQVRWLETYATLKRDDDSPNEMWATRPFGQLDKCAEAAALRSAFPEEVGNDYTNDEVGRGERMQEAGGLATLATGRTSFTAKGETKPIEGEDSAPAVDTSVSGDVIDRDTGEVKQDGSVEKLDEATSEKKTDALFGKKPNEGTVERKK